MPADQPRTRTVGCKMTDSEYEKLVAVAEQDGQTLREWYRCRYARVAKRAFGWPILSRDLPLLPSAVDCLRRLGP